MKGLTSTWECFTRKSADAESGEGGGGRYWILRLAFAIIRLIDKEFLTGRNAYGSAGGGGALGILSYELGLFCAEKVSSSLERFRWIISTRATGGGRRGQRRT